MSKREILSWTSQMDDYFIEAMLHQCHEGNRHDGTFTSTAYANIVKELHEKLSQYEFTKSHLKNRLKTVKDTFNKCYDLFKNLSVFSWSPTTKMWDAEPEVWRTLIESKPQAKKWMTKTVNNYEKLLELFSKDRATGEGAVTTKERKRRWGNSTTDNEGEINTVIDVDVDSILENQDTEAGGNTEINCNQTSASQCDDRTQSKRKKRRDSNNSQDDEAMKSALNSVAKAIMEGNNVIRDTNIILQERNVIARESRSRVYSESEIYKELMAMKVQPPLFEEAYLFLAQNPDKARIVFGFPVDERPAFLQKLLDVALFS